MDIGNEPRPVLVVPHWDPWRRELWFDGVLIKQFRQPSPYQEMILFTFQEEGWPPSIDDPLPYTPEQDSKRRLNQAVRNLNRSHKVKLIRFGGDGTGNRITWQRIFKKSVIAKSNASIVCDRATVERR